jgi:predicted Zn-dependent peptidase
MQQPDRINAPSFSEIDKINLRELSFITLPNGAPLYYINTPQTSVLKIDFVFNGGLRNQISPGQATATNTLLTEGTSEYTAKQLADHLDQFGSYLQVKTNTDDSQITLYCLPKFLQKCAPFVRAVLTDCTFPESELETYKTNTIQRFLINSQRNSFLGRRAFYASIFGKQNAYGSLVNIEDYQNISRGTLSQFYTENILPGYKYMLVSGDVSNTVLTELEDVFGSLPNDPTPLSPIEIQPEKPSTHLIENPYSVQSSIRVGRTFVNRNHPDFNKLQLLNLALGGFFGSRLMKNIREEKGLTYGIFSAIESYQNGGAFYIETEINNELREKGLSEIMKEIAKLRENLIPDSELILVKNYMTGSFLRGIDGPFSLMDRHKMIIDYGFTYQYFQNFVDTIKSTTAIELQDLANQYFQEDAFTTVIVGKKSYV